MDEQTVPDQEQHTDETPQPAMIAAILLFAGLWIAGIAMGISELAQRKSA